MFLGLINTKCDFGDAVHQKKELASLREKKDLGGIPAAGSSCVGKPSVSQRTHEPPGVVWVSEGTSFPDLALGPFHMEETARSCSWPQQRPRPGLLLELPSNETQGMSSACHAQKMNTQHGESGLSLRVPGREGLALFAEETVGT